MMSLPRKRSAGEGDEGDETGILASLSRSISPPPKRVRLVAAYKSPWQLTRIRDLPDELNKDTIMLKDILGDPLIFQCWQFNFLYDIPFVVNAFHESVRHSVELHVVHGFWKTNESPRVTLSRDASRYPNVHLHCAPMPAMFGTHHSKMMVLFRSDDTAQVIIHTANMIPRDWTNMTNAVWMSQKLPVLPDGVSMSRPGQLLPVGSGGKFKEDLLEYLMQYDSHRIICKDLVKGLDKHDFSSIRAALIASVPGNHPLRGALGPAWGWGSLKRCLRDIPVEPGESEIVVQISSIATLGAKNDWLQNALFNSLATCSTQNEKRPDFKVVFPTADEIRNSLDGYDSGVSIHAKIESPQHIQQLHYLHPMLHHWAKDRINGPEVLDGAPIRGDSGRNRAAPHIKTYMRFNKDNSIAWAMLTSANMSKQAWGDAPKLTERKTREVKVASWEVGVLVWPELLCKDGVMVSSFQSDTPDASPFTEGQRPLIGLRMPYSMPLQAYGKDEVPWAPTTAHTRPDWKGHMWAYPKSSR